MSSKSKPKPADRKNQFMYGKALSYVDSVTRHGVFRERTNINLDKTEDDDPSMRTSTREAFLSLRFPLLGPDRRDANTYHRLKRKKARRAKSPQEALFDIKRSHVKKSSSPDHTGFRLPAIETNQAKFVSHSWDAQSAIEVRPNLIKNNTQYQSLPDIRSLKMGPRTRNREIKITPRDRVMFPSIHGYHERSQSPTYKQLIGVRERLNNVVDNLVREFYHMMSIDSNISVDEFFARFVDTEHLVDDDEEHDDVSDGKNDDQMNCSSISLIKCRPKMELSIEKSEFEKRIQVSEMYEGTEDDTMTTQNFSVFNILLSNSNRDGLDTFLKTEGTAESLNIVKKASKSKVEGWDDTSDDETFTKLKAKLERSKTRDKLKTGTTKEKDHNHETLPKLSRQQSKMKLSVTDNISANLDAVLARIDNLDKTIDVDSVGKALGNIGGKHVESTPKEKEISPEEKKKREKIKAMKEKIQKSRPMKVGDLFYEKHKAKAVDKLAKFGNLTAEEANDLFLTRDHKVLSQKFIEKYNDVAFGSDSSDDEHET